MSLVSTNCAWKGWVHVVDPGPSKNPPPLDRKDIAAIFAGSLDVRSIMRLASASRGTYHAYRPQLDIRLVVLFNLYVGQNPSHRQVMEALRQQIPVGETKRLIVGLNELFRQYGDEIRRQLLKDIGDMNCRATRFQIPNEFGREDLLHLGVRVFKAYSTALMPVIRYIPKVEIHRLLFSIARSLPQEHFMTKWLVSATTGALSVAASQENNVGLPRPWGAFKACWNTMNVCEQAKALVLLGRSFALESADHPALAFVADFLKDETVIWAAPAMKEVSTIVTERARMNFRRIIVIEKILEELAKPTSNKPPVIECLLSLLSVARTSTEEDEWETIQDCIAPKVAFAQMQTAEPSLDAIAYMLCTHPDDERFQAVFARFKEEWKHLSASEQARRVLFLGERAYFGIRDPQGPAAQLVRAFVENKYLGWKHSSIQKACAFLVKHRFDFDPSRNYIRDMLQVVADPAYEDAREPVLQQLSNIVACEHNEDTTGAGLAWAEWQKFTKILAAKKMEEFSAITTTEELQVGMQLGILHLR